MNITRLFETTERTVSFEITDAEPLEYRGRLFQPTNFSVTVIVGRDRAIRRRGVLTGPAILKGGSLGARQVTLHSWDSSQMPSWAWELIESVKLEDSER